MTSNHLPRNTYRALFVSIPLPGMPFLFPVTHLICSHFDLVLALFISLCASVLSFACYPSHRICVFDSVS